MLNPLGREAGKDFRWESVCLLLCPAKLQNKILCCCCWRCCFWKHSELTGSENMQLFAFCNLKSNVSTVSDLLTLTGFDKPGEYRTPDQFLGVGKFIDFFQWMCPRKRAAGRSQPALQAESTPELMRMKLDAHGAKHWALGILNETCKRITFR